MRIDETHHHGLAVVDEGGDLYGVVTLSDLERAGSQQLLGGLVRDVCTTAVRTVYPDETLEDALLYVGALGVGHLPVVARADSRRLLGMLRRSDIVRTCARVRLDDQERLHHLERLRLEYAMEARAVEIVLDDDDFAVGKTLRELQLPCECVVVSIHRGAHVLIPRGDTRLLAGDRVVASATEAGEAALKEFLAWGGAVSAGEREVGERAV